jgi:hypothetical protein
LEDEVLAEFAFEPDDELCVALAEGVEKPEDGNAPAIEIDMAGSGPDWSGHAKTMPGTLPQKSVALPRQGRKASRQ